MKLDYLKSCVFRSYVALARAERIVPSEIATWDVYNERNGEYLESIPMAQIDFDEDGELIKLAFQARQVTPERFTELMIFRRPTPLQNALYSARIRRHYPQTVAAMEEFENGVMVLPKQRGLMLPIKKGKLITRLGFVALSQLVKKETV